MNLYKESKKEYEKNKRKKLNALKRQLWWKGAKPTQWDYDYMSGKWKAFHAVDDMEVIAQLDTYESGKYESGKIGDVYFEVSYSKGKNRYYSGVLRYWSDVKLYVGNRIAERSKYE